MSWLQTIITTIVGAALAWGASEWNRRSNRKDEWAKIRRAKLEEVFAEMASVERKAMQLSINEMSKQQGLSVSPSEPLELTRLSALLSLYFPEARPIVQAHDKRQDEAQTARIVQMRAAIKKNDPSALRGLGLQTAVETNVEVGQYVRELRPVLEEIAAKLGK